MKEKQYTWEEARDYIQSQGYDFEPFCPLWDALHFDSLIANEETVSQSELDKAIETYGEKVKEKPENYSTGYFLTDKEGYSYVRGSFPTVKQAKDYAAEHGYDYWKVVGYNYDREDWDVLASSENSK